jgi:hypothetical protein
LASRGQDLRTVHDGLAAVMLCVVRDAENPRSSELEELRLMLFPRLSPAEGRRRIDAAFEGAADRGRVERIERLANDPDLAEELVRRLRELRDNEPTT